MRYNVAILVYEGFEILDMAGPAAVFGNANAVVGKEAYRVSTVAMNGGPVRSSGGIVIFAEETADFVSPGTIIVAGAEAEPLGNTLRDENLLGWLRNCAAAGSRMGSVCTGAFLLARAGLLEGRRATTHWAARGDLSRLYPAANVEDDALYVEDDGIWSSAGIATGIDMALAMVARDFGASVMHDVASRMVVYAHRPGTQSQFSGMLASQRRAPGRLSDLVAYIDANLASDLSVPRLAELAGMSERTLHRRFVAMIGQSPARYVENARMDRARLLLAQGQSIKQVAAHIGYKTEQGFRAAFEAQFSMSPSLHKRLHRTSLPT